MEIFQITKMTTDHKRTSTALSIELLVNALTRQSEIVCEHKITVFIYFMYVYLFDYPNFLNKSWSQGGRIIAGALYLEISVTGQYQTNIIWPEILSGIPKNYICLCVTHKHRHRY